MRAEEPPASEEPKQNERPRTARRAPPKLASNEVKVEKRGAVSAAADGTAPAGVILEGGGDADDDDTVLMVDQQGEAVDTSSMLNDGGEGHGKLVRNLLDAKLEMESAGDDDAKKDEAGGDSGIILGGKKAGGAAGGRLPTKTEINTLRASIQQLCQSCNPLGRCLEYVQEDMEAMAKELEQWRALRRLKATELADEEAKSESSLVALHNELAAVENSIKEKRTQIRFYKAAVVRNDATIERLLNQVVQAG